MERRRPAAPVPLALGVHHVVIDDESLGAKPQSSVRTRLGPVRLGRGAHRCGSHRCGSRSTLLGSIALALLALFEARRFCTSRCYLIDWWAGTRLVAVPIVATQSQLNAHIAAHEPALLHNALLSWPAVRKWSPAYFGRELGSQQVEVFFWGRSGADWMRTRVYVLTLAEYARLQATYEQRLAQLGYERAGPAPYLQEDETLFSEHEERLLPDVASFPFRPYLTDVDASDDRIAAHGGDPADVVRGAGWMRRAPFGVETETAFWMGPANARTGIHWDSIDALLHQVVGSKRITLWPPSARRDLYVSSKYNHGAELSDVDAALPNLTRFPRFANARSLSVTLSAGSALYLPAGWWHAVTSLDATISIALRSQGSCERRAALVDDVLLWMHNLGLYKRGNCVCHRAQHTAVGSEDDGLGGAVEDLLRASGVEPQRVMRRSMSDDDDAEEEEST